MSSATQGPQQIDFDRYRTSQKLDLKTVAEHFESLGFTNLDLFQNWRHVTGKCEKGGKEIFLKLASTVEVSEWTNSEYSWNSLVNNLPNNQRLPVKIPQIYESGQYEGRFWFTSEYIEGKVLARPEDQHNTKDLENHLPDIVNILLKMQELNLDSPLPHDVSRGSGTQVQNKIKVFMDQIAHWMSSAEYKANDLYKFIEEQFRTSGKVILEIERVLTHQDFVPWHFLLTESKDLYLIDAEHGRTDGLKFYDLAYIYHRLYCKLRRPDIADALLKLFTGKYQPKGVEKAWFYILLSQRTLGGYYDATNDKKDNLDLDHELRGRILSDSILS